ncbi:MAG TPA: CYTH domain-containing protein, partial [Thermomicrobiales bacterium]
MVRRGIELEVKFAPVGEHTLDELAARTEFPGWRILSRHTEAQHNTYFDTPDALLEAARCSLRRRIIDDGAGGVEWTFKRGRGPGRDGVARRREVNALLSGKKIDLPKAKCEPVARARLVAREQPLQPLFTLLTDRQQIELVRADGGRVA